MSPVIRRLGRVLRRYLSASREALGRYFDTSRDIGVERALLITGQTVLVCGTLTAVVLAVQDDVGAAVAVFFGSAAVAAALAIGGWNVGSEELMAAKADLHQTAVEQHLESIGTEIHGFGELLAEQLAEQKRTTETLLRVLALRVADEPAEAELRATVRQAREAGASVSELARQLGLSRKRISQLLSE